MSITASVSPDSPLPSDGYACLNKLSIPVIPWKYHGVCSLIDFKAKLNFLSIIALSGSPTL